MDPHNFSARLLGTKPRLLEVFSKLDYLCNAESIIYYTNEVPVDYSSLIKQHHLVSFIPIRC